MLAQELIRIKREGMSLSAEQIDFFIAGMLDQSITESQVAALTMAIFFRGLSRYECVALTRSQQRSGTTLGWSAMDLSGPVIDKHSTGGVGDKVSLMLAPMLAACGAYVPMISGRGLGHTGGTLDKMDSIPGYNTSPNIELFQRVVQQIGCAIVGQTAELAPADKRLYSVRDVTATVDSIPLITASILSKKLSAGLDCLMMDIKTGNGAFATDHAIAKALGTNIIEVGWELGLPIKALITDMSQVLGATAGNTLEVIETLHYLSGEYRDSRLHDVVVGLGVELLMLSKLSSNVQDATKQLNDCLSNGAAAEYFGRMVAALGGPIDFIDKPANYLTAAQVVIPAYGEMAGTISAIDVRAIGNIVVELGGGRRRPQDPVDHSVGLSEIKGLGDSIGPGEPLAMIHAANRNTAERALAQLRSAFTLAPTAPIVRPIIIERLGGRAEA